MNNNQKSLEFFKDAHEADRANRLCVTLSDIHLTDGTVGFQNLEDSVWEEFYDSLAAHCQRNDIEKVTLILDGDVVDMIRSDKWAEAGVYPWERGNREEFSRIVNEIIREIVKVHKVFFDWLKGLKQRLVSDTENQIQQEDDINIVVILGNHDKELLCDNDALTYFYKEGLGKNLDQFTDEERKWIGRMYGDEMMFSDTSIAPYFPFYYADRGFRFFVTHGQWRDASNSRKIYAVQGQPGWTVKDGWQNKTWQELKFSPFFEPCFGDSVAAGVLSTFIYETKIKLRKYEKEQQDKKEFKQDIEPEIIRLSRILDELDLYRPTYKAIVRILDESDKLHNQRLVEIIEQTLFKCIMRWLEWDFTYESSSIITHVLLKIGKYVLKLLNWLKLHKFVALKLVRAALVTFEYIHIFKSLFRNIFRLLSGKDISTTELTLKDMQGFPAFMPEYRHYGFQLHGEGHTHIPLEEEPNVRSGRPTTYVNFGTWRDQVLGRKNKGYRRRGILRLFYILDLKQKTNEYKNNEQRRFNYFTEDVLKWSDKKDDLY